MIIKILLQTEKHLSPLFAYAGRGFLFKNNFMNVPDIISGALPYSYFYIVLTITAYFRLFYKPIQHEKNNFYHRVAFSYVCKRIGNSAGSSGKTKTGYRSQHQKSA